MEENKELFRKVALERLSSPEQLDRLLQVTSARSWLILAAILLLCGIAIVWSFTGYLEKTVEGYGMLTVSDSSGAQPETEAVMYIPIRQVGRVKVGMDVNLFVLSLPPQENGYIHAAVTSVGQYPAADEAAQAFANQDEPVVEVRVALERDSETPSGFEWSIGDGPESPLTLGTMVRGEIVVERQHPIEKVLPVLGILP